MGHLQRHSAEAEDPLRNLLDQSGDRHQTAGRAGRAVATTPSRCSTIMTVPSRGEVQPGGCRAAPSSTTATTSSCARFRCGTSFPRVSRREWAPAGDSLLERPQPVDLVAEPSHRRRTQRSQFRRRAAAGEREQRHSVPEPDVQARGRGCVLMSFRGEQGDEHNQDTDLRMGHEQGRARASGPPGAGPRRLMTHQSPRA